MYYSQSQWEPKPTAPPPVTSFSSSESGGSVHSSALALHITLGPYKKCIIFPYHSPLYLHQIVAYPSSQTCAKLPLRFHTSSITITSRRDLFTLTSYTRHHQILVHPSSNFSRELIQVNRQTPYMRKLKMVKLNGNISGIHRHFQSSKFNFIHQRLLLPGGHSKVTSSLQRFQENLKYSNESSNRSSRK